jgi:hypothetical protein
MESYPRPMLHSSPMSVLHAQFVLFALVVAVVALCLLVWSLALLGAPPPPLPLGHPPLDPCPGGVPLPC